MLAVPPQHGRRRHHPDDIGRSTGADHAARVDFEVLKEARRVQDYETIQALKGHSGCQVELCRRGRVHFVRKLSASRAYNARLLSQIEKQRRLSRFIPVPAIISHDVEDGLVLFEMEFVQGRDFVAQSLTERLPWIYGLVDQIFETWRTLERMRRPAELESRFSAKARDLRAAVTRHARYPAHAGTLDRALDRLDAAAWSAVPATECHGDLTLENIIFRPDGSLVFIDLLDGELDSFWLDAAKLMFDLSVGWSIRHVLWEPEPTQEARLLRMLTRYLAEEIESRLRRDHPDLLRHLPHLQRLQALRILPYTQDQTTFGHLVDFLSALDGAPEA
jgi:aminoglycoside phosphotransferase (APT) family kinase protein